MKLENIVYDIKHILGASRSDTRVYNSWLINKINQYRAAAIQMEYLLSMQIKGVWVQNLGVHNVRKVTSADDPLIELSSIYLGKLELPPVVSLMDDTQHNMGYYRITSGSGQKKYWETSEQNLYDMIACDHEHLKSFMFFFNRGHDIYIYPWETIVIPNIILENPLDGIVRKTDYVKNDAIEPDVQYDVLDKSIVYGGVTYREGDILVRLQRNICCALIWGA